ncbi:MAG: hypothetical protein RL536_163 [Candidatus Parcubacteria bacterium]|jgi:uncharacterized membrane protein (UPF0127 family)
MRTIFILGAVLIGIGILVYVAEKSISTKAVPSLQEFVASTTVSSADTIKNIESVLDLASTTTEIQDQTPSLTPLNTPKGTLYVYVAKNPTTREQGLSGYPSLDADQGMLFIFPTENPQSFWMQDMNFPLDIVWMDRYKKIIGVTPNISPKTYPKTFASPGKVQFVLEINAGSAEKFGLREGTTVIF